MFQGLIALIVRYLLMMGGSALVTVGLFTENGPTGFCLDVGSAVEFLNNGLLTASVGGLSIFSSVAWRTWVKSRGGTT